LPTTSARIFYTSKRARERVFVVRNAEGWREYEAAVDDTYR
jgi:hypothetical protein